MSQLSINLTEASALYMILPKQIEDLSTTLTELKRELTLWETLHGKKDTNHKEPISANLQGEITDLDALHSTLNGLLIQITLFLQNV